MSDEDDPVGDLDEDPIMEAYRGGKSRAPLDRAVEERKRRLGVKSASMRAEEIHGGVSVGWLAEVFRLDPATVRKRLGGLAPVEVTKQGNRYLLPDAAARLVKPVIDVTRYLKTMTAKDLPPTLQAHYWSAMRDKQAWERDAGELWKTDDVLDVFTDTFQTIKSTCQLWVDELERSVGLSDAQRTALVELVDGLQNDLYGKLIEQASRKRTRSQIAEAPPEVLKPQTPPEEDII